jgi:hypothetical protein
MDEKIRINIENLYGADRQLKNEAYYYILEITEEPVEWAYEVWDQAVENLSHKDNHNRAIASQLLCNLAKSDPENRIMRDFDLLLDVTRDEKFVTARHCLQSLWKIGLPGKEHRAMVSNGLARRFQDCAAEKNCTLIRFDIVSGLRKLYNATNDEEIKRRALELIETEEDPKYRKKYSSVWRR